LLVNDHEIIPASVAGAAEKYPHHALDFLRTKGLRVAAIPASARAKDLGDGRMANVVMLGALSALLTQLPLAVWLITFKERLPAKYQAQNLNAFETGRGLITSAFDLFSLPLAVTGERPEAGMNGGRDERLDRR
jgi:indolepyruvate ferredoxin oxidoreductase beta subunit